LFQSSLLFFSGLDDFLQPKRSSSLSRISEQQRTFGSIRCLCNGKIKISANGSFFNTNTNFRIQESLKFRGMS